ncbi:GNAT family N-acetyltransferase [Halocatena halophila]|uniref:GNAT family N-acetyltransferase n=1 Tax=Halocatena halophila TaxID=2814576 RepID=UPI002ED49058
MRIRPATPADRSELPALHTATVEAFGPEAYDQSTVEAWAKAGERTPSDYVTDNTEHFTVAIKNDDIVGFGHLIPEKSAVHAVYVHPDHARTGVGSALLAELEGYARGCGCEELSLQASLNAVGFYEQAGYTAVEAVDLDGIRVCEMTKALCV